MQSEQTNILKYLRILFVFYISNRDFIYVVYLVIFFKGFRFEKEEVKKEPIKTIMISNPPCRKRRVKTAAKRRPQRTLMFYINEPHRYRKYKVCASEGPTCPVLLTVLLHLTVLM